MNHNEPLNAQGGATSNTRENHIERRRYYNYVKSLENVKFLDTLYKQRHYGFINKNYEVIQNVVGTEPIPFGAYSSGVHGTNYIVDMFNSFRNFYLKNVNASTMDIPQSIATLVPSKSYVSFDDSYLGYIFGIRNLIMTLMTRNMEFSGDNVLTPLEFYVKFNRRILFAPELENYPFSKSGYALSEHSTVFETGLYIDLGRDFSTNEDFLKGQLIQDPAFQCYFEVANQFGFLIDLNAPWRLALDLNSSYTRLNILNGRELSQFSGFYYDTYKEIVPLQYDYWNIKDFYENLYKEYYILKNNLSDREISEMNWTETYRNLSMNLDRRDVPPGFFWLEILLINRMREIGLLTLPPEFSPDSKFGEYTNNLLDIYRQYGLSSSRVNVPVTGAIGYINKICSQELKDIIGQR